MRFFFIFFFVLSISSVSIAQNCDDYHVEIKDNNLTEITAQYQQIIEQQMGDNDTVMPSNFMEIARCYVLNIQKTKEIKQYSIPEDFKEERPDLVFLIFSSRSLEKEGEKRSWFNLSPMMTSEQKDKLYHILQKEFLRIHQIERKHERNKEEIARKYEYIENGSNKSDTTFKYLGTFTKYSTTGVIIGTELDEWYINQQGLAVSVSNGKAVELSSIDFLSAKDLSVWEEKSPKEINNYEKFICSYLYNIQNAQASFPKDSLAQKILFSFWEHLTLKYYKNNEKNEESQHLALFPMENYVEREKKKDVCSFRYRYLMFSKLKYYEYDKAAEYLTLYLQNEQPPKSPQSFLFYLYITVLGNNNATDKSTYAAAEQEFVNWYKKTNSEELMHYLTNYYSETSFIMADYYLTYGTNDELKGIVKNILNEFKKQLSLDKFPSSDWYHFLNKAYFSDEFNNDYTLGDLRGQLSQNNFKFEKDEGLVEYATYYCLYKMKHFQANKANRSEILRILDYIERACAYPNPTYFYCEKDIAIDLKSRLNDDINRYELSALEQAPPKIQITTKFEKEYKQSRQEIQLVAGNGSEEVQTLEVFINDVRLLVDPSNTDYSDPFAWKYKQDFDLKIGENGEKENTLIIKCMDAAGRMACDTITIIYNPDDYMDRKDYAILFAVDDYSNVERCGNLFKPIEDAEKFAKILAEEYGFDTLVVRNPTKRSINSTIKTYQKKEYGPFDQLLIFYAGHGYFDDFGLGYIVPSDGDIDDDDKLVDYASLAAKINGISCSHILFICDACHSGSFLTLQRAARPDIQMQNEVMKNKSRLFLGSCLAKDETPDKSALMDKICKKLRDQDRNMPIDFYSLIGLTYTTGNTTEEKQKAFGEFGDHEIGGDFFFNKK